MEKEIYTTLIYKSLKGEITLEEQQKLDAFCEESEENFQFREEIELTWQLSHQPSRLSEIDVEADLKRVKSRMVEKVEAAPKPATKLIPIWKRMSSIAAGFAFLYLATYAAYQFVGSSLMNSIVATEMVKELELADGTKIWLNKGSQLDYPKQFAADSRKVVLTGEAYFEVERNEVAPFSVEVGNSQVRVLGTSFSIAERIAEQLLVVSVQSGKVNLSNANQSVDLTKNEQGIHHLADGTIEKKVQNTQNEIVWKTGRFVFQEETLANIIRKVEKEFGASIEIENKNLYNCKLSAMINQTTLTEVLNKIARSVKMDVEEKDASTYVLKNGTCQ